jgi:hypothetical protein
MAIQRQVEADVRQPRQPRDERRSQLRAVGQNLDVGVADGQRLDQLRRVGEQEQLAAAQLDHRGVDVLPQSVDHGEYLVHRDDRPPTAGGGGGRLAEIAGVRHARAVAALEVAEIPGDNQVMIKKALHVACPRRTRACHGPSRKYN